MRENQKQKEIFRLRDMLDAAGIKYSFMEQRANQDKPPLSERILNGLFDLSAKEPDGYQITISHPNNTKALLSVISLINAGLDSGDTLEISEVMDSPNQPQSGRTAEECLEIIKKFIA